MAKIPIGKKVNRACQECGGDLIVRQNRRTKQHFLGCIRYPQCQYTEPLPEDLKMKAMGAERLPGFERVEAKRISTRHNN